MSSKGEGAKSRVGCGEVRPRRRGRGGCEKQYECSLAGSKNQKFEFRSRLQLRRIGVHINQQRTGTAQDVARGAEGRKRGRGKGVCSQSVSQSNVVFPPLLLCEFCKSSGNATQGEKKLEIEASCEN